MGVACSYRTAFIKKEWIEEIGNPAARLKIIPDTKQIQKEPGSSCYRFDSKQLAVMVPRNANMAAIPVARLMDSVFDPQVIPITAPE